MSLTGPDDSDDPTSIDPSTFRLDGRHVLVTGGGRGLGRGIAVSAARAGAHITALSRSAVELHHTADLVERYGGTCTAYPADLCDIDAIEAHIEAISEHGIIDGVVHAAGVQVRKDAVQVSADEWRRVQTMNVEAPFFLSTAIARTQLTEKRRGSHVFVGSLNSTIGLPRIAPYAASKTALLGVARSLSTEWSGSGLRANVIGPGYFRTKLTEDLFAEPGNEERILGRIPTGRLGTAADLGGPAVFLLSDASAYLTGQLINVDGGWLAS